MHGNKKFVVGFTHDIIPASCTPEEREYYLSHGEAESQETIQSIMNALRKSGNEVIPLGVHPPHLDGRKLSQDEDVYFKLHKFRDDIDIVFNNAEYFETKNRESLVPAILEYLQIPFTGSDATALGKAMNKADSIEILQNYGINIAPYIVFRNADMSSIKRYLHKLEKVFPLIVKPIGEGTSIGMDQSSVVETLEQLRKSISRVISEYDQPAMVQQFLEGEEYTVGIVGDLILPILKLDLSKLPDNPRIRDPVVKELDITYSEPARFNELYVSLAAQAATAHTALSCNDYNRLDFRRGKDGKAYFLEANPFPGLSPESSDLPKIAKMAGINHDVLVNMVLFEAIKRYREDENFSERFSDKRVGHVFEFIEPTLNSLETYGASINPSMNGYDVSYSMVKVKKHGPRP